MAGAARRAWRESDDDVSPPRSISAASSASDVTSFGVMTADVTRDGVMRDDAASDDAGSDDAASDDAASNDAASDDTAGGVAWPSPTRPRVRPLAADLGAANDAATNL